MLIGLDASRLAANFAALLAAGLRLPAGAAAGLRAGAPCVRARAPPALVPPAAPCVHARAPGPALARVLSINDDTQNMEG